MHDKLSIPIIADDGQLLMENSFLTKEYRVQLGTSGYVGGNRLILHAHGHSPSVCALLSLPAARILHQQLTAWLKANGG